MRAELLAVAELDDVAGRVSDGAEIAGRRVIIARLPMQQALAPPARSDLVDVVARGDAKAVMRHVVFVLLSRRSTAEQHQNEVVFLAGACEPSHAPLALAVLLDDFEPAIAAIEVDRPIEIVHMQGAMGEGWLHVPPPNGLDLRRRQAASTLRCSG